MARAAVLAAAGLSGLALCAPVGAVSASPAAPAPQQAAVAADARTSGHLVRCGPGDRRSRSDHRDERLTTARVQAMEQQVARDAAAAGLASGVQQVRTSTPRYVAAATRVVPVYVHVITPGSTSPVTSTLVGRQITELNRAYAPAGYRFTLVATDRTVNSGWYSADPDSFAGRQGINQMKSSLFRGDKRSLNIYLTGMGNNILGWSTFPQDRARSPRQDGIVILDASLPGASRSPYALGRTAVHEAGHWLGLYHTFQGQSCSGDGDYVADTPAQSAPSEGCPVGKDSCPSSPGADDVHNYMDYGDDACMTHLTTGQIIRTRMMWRLYRA